MIIVVPPVLSGLADSKIGTRPGPGALMSALHRWNRYIKDKGKILVLSYQISSSDGACCECTN